MSNTTVNYDPKLFYEELNRLVNEPHEYNRLLARTIANFTQSMIQWQDGIPYILDPYRGKWVSFSRSPYVASYYGTNMSSRYLKFGEVASMSEQGLFIPKNAVVTGLWSKSRSTDNWILELRKNGSPITLASVDIVGSFGGVTTLDIDLDEGDWAQIFMNGAKVDHPVASLELTWRL